MNIAIIGAGVGGMAAAWDFARAGHTVTIYEAANYVGGLASGFKEPHWEWSVEKFYHHWFQTDAHMLGMIEELGRHGYKISPGSLYPLLQRLEEKGYLRSTEVQTGRSRRKVYRATPLGRKVLAAAKHKVRELFHELIEGK